MEEVKMNWLSDQNGNLLAPKTLIEAIQNAKGTSLEELLNSSSGLPEVYIGNEEPTEEGIEIFIDTSENVEEHYTVAFADTPIGTIISYMGNTAPKDYLICDGTEYEIVKYKDLAEHIKTEFGSYNYFGGDGTTTFAVPDLRGEFLRGSGENSRDRQGSGANVGEHQNATEHIHYYTFNGGVQFPNNKQNQNQDTILDIVSHVDGNNDFGWRGTETTPTYFTSRPTNTSVLYCIKYKVDKKSANIIPQHEYSTEEKVVGTWIDGKPLYEKTVYFGSGTLSNRASVSFENMNIDKIMLISGTFEDTIDGQLSIPVLLDGTLHVGFYCNRSGILLTFSGAFNGRISNAYAIIQYTKTTD